MRKTIKGIRNFLIYFFLRFIFILANLLPLKIAYGLANLLSILSYHVFPSDRNTAMSNLKTAFPDKDPKQLDLIYRKSLINMGLCAIDVLRFKSLGKNGILNIVEVEGMDDFDRAYQRGKGIAAVTGHISNFELIAAWFGQAGYKASAVGRRIYDQRLNKLLIDNRKATNVKNIDSEEPANVFMRTLREGYAIGVLIDQDSRRYRGEFIDFFGKSAYTPIGPILLARTVKAAVVPLIILRKPDGNYFLKVFPEIKFDYSAERMNDVKKVLADATKVLEQVIRENPEQWVWMHKRWNTRPEDIKVESEAV
ncbi:MAG: hypothetical protein GF315_04980 [candidate division Zixibacteria bacterium]|nr:hypothetical protein [candidate division Zixibacteria bacterium]